MSEGNRIRPEVGVSACLLGESVRHDGGHKRDRFLTDVLADYFKFLKVCPETAIGRGIPRPAIRLVGDLEQPRARGTSDPSLDVTGRLEEYAGREADSFARLSGFILKKDSPSCGMQRVKVYPEQGGPAARNGQGVFARILMERHPLLPVEEEGRLNDPVLRENFINRVYVYHQWRQLFSAGVTAARLIGFHTRHKYLVMAHSQAAYKRMGKMLSDLRSGAVLEELAQCYVAELMSALARRVTRPRHVNVLQHIMGYLKRNIDGGDKAELTASIEAYRRGEVPLVVPVTLFKHYFRRHPDPYIANQIYLQPHPESLGLRNHL
jgi:uncharacterized protein YbgA (DUF1722 family)/uncharacterized protein YbbK (DUF523 family)